MTERLSPGEKFVQRFPRFGRIFTRTQSTEVDMLNGGVVETKIVRAYLLFGERKEITTSGRIKDLPKEKK